LNTDEQFSNQLPNEPCAACAAFAIYRDLGPVRTIAGVVQILADPTWRQEDPRIGLQNRATANAHRALAPRLAVGGKNCRLCAGL